MDQKLKISWRKGSSQLCVTATFSLNIGNHPVRRTRAFVYKTGRGSKFIRKLL
jgi:hypothetical protein